MTSRAAIVLFFLSGATSLGFEVVWAKQLGVVLGGTTTSIAFVVALFMGGMSLGYGVGARVAPTRARPLAAYGVAEIVLAGWGLLTVHLAPQLVHVTSTPLTFVLAAALLLPCTFLAGLTLPLLTQSTRGSVGSAMGLLYGFNTAGAVLGVLVTGLFVIGALGLQATGLVLAVAGSAVGACAIVLGRNPHAPVLPATPVSDTSTAQSPASPILTTEPTAPATRGTLWLAVALSTGIASLAAEVLWTRALIPHLSSSTYALSSILAVFLLGLALGAALAGRVIARGRDARTWLAGTQLAAGALVLVSPEMLDFAEKVVTGYVGLRRIDGLLVWLYSTWVALARTATAVLLPATMFGFALPILAELYAIAPRPRARAVGVLASWNTVGSVLGSLGARFVLLPLVGLSGGLRAVAILHAVTAGSVALESRRGRMLVAFAGILLVASIARPESQPFLGRLAFGHDILFVDEGVQDTTAVIELANGRGARQILSNGIAYAGNTPEAKRYMRLLGHLPSLHAARRERALVICLGTGMTAGAVLRHPFRTADLVDISPVVYHTLPMFSGVNDRVFENPRGHIRIEDGRVFLARATPGSYDVVTLEPPPPRAAGVSALYSREFYEMAKRALRPGGAIAQWLPVHGMTNDDLRLLARTFQHVFPDAILYEAEHHEGALVATVGRGASDDEIAQRSREPGVAAHFAEIGVTSVAGLPQVRGRALARALGTGPIVTDDFPRIEHFAARLALRPASESTDDAGQEFLDEMLGAQRRNTP